MSDDLPDLPTTWADLPFASDDASDHSAHAAQSAYDIIFAEDASDSLPDLGDSSQSSWGASGSTSPAAGPSTYGREASEEYEAEIRRSASREAVETTKLSRDTRRVPALKMAVMHFQLLCADAFEVERFGDDEPMVMDIGKEILKISACMNRLTALAERSEKETGKKWKGKGRAQ